MDRDAILDAMSGGEEIIDVYKDTNWFSPTETTISFTDTRLLIRWKEWGCGSSRFSYSAITLNSISRIDDKRPHGKSLFLAVTTAIIGLIIAVAGFETLSINPLVRQLFIPPVGPVTAAFIGVFGILVMLASLGVLVYIIPLLLKETIVLTGTFGRVSFRLRTEEARKFERQLSGSVNQNPSPHGNGTKSSRQPLARPNDNVGRGSRISRGRGGSSSGAPRTSYREDDDA